MTRGTLRWLLRTLSAPTILYRIWQERAGGSVISLLEAFDRLPPDQEHHSGADRDAARVIIERISEIGPALQQFRRLVWLLPWIANPDDLADLARYRCLPQLFTLNCARVESDVEFHEIHVHFRGAVPFAALWSRWIGAMLTRQALYRDTYQIEPAHLWQNLTWGELIEAAVDAMNAGGVIDLESSIEQTLRVPTQAFGARQNALLFAIAVATALRVHLGHQRGESGLSRFVLSYDRYAKTQKTRGRKKKTNRRLLCDVLQQYERVGVRLIELRPTLEKTVKKTRNRLQNLVNGWFDYAKGRTDPVRMVLVPSLFKQETWGDSQNLNSQHWNWQLATWRNQVETLIGLVEQDVLLRMFIGGIDAAGEERGCPPRVFKESFELVRAYHRRHQLTHHQIGPTLNVGQLQASWYQSSRCIQETALPRLGVTVHAGEDFADPITGLRHIWEALNTLDLQPGDRLGHALAAGLTFDDVRVLLRRRAAGPRDDILTHQDGFDIRKPRGTHLLDLAWLSTILPEQKSTFAAELAHSAGNIFGGPEFAQEFASELMTSSPLATITLPSVRFLDPKEVAPQHLVWVRVDTLRLQFFEDARQRVLQEIKRRKVVVESCPTSNIAVAGLERPVTQEFLRTEVLVTVATDDPGIFGAWPAEELNRFAQEERQRLIAQSRRASFAVI